MTDGDFQGGLRLTPRRDTRQLPPCNTPPPPATTRSAPRACLHQVSFPFSPMPLSPPFQRDSFQIELGRIDCPHCYFPSFGIAVPAYTKTLTIWFNSPFSVEGWLLQYSGESGRQLEQPVFLPLPFSSLSSYLTLTTTLQPPHPHPPKRSNNNDSQHSE